MSVSFHCFNLTLTLMGHRPTTWGGTLALESKVWNHPIKTRKASVGRNQHSGANQMRSHDFYSTPHSSARYRAKSKAFLFRL